MFKCLGGYIKSTNYIIRFGTSAFRWLQSLPGDGPLQAQHCATPWVGKGFGAYTMEWLTMAKVAVLGYRKHCRLMPIDILTLCVFFVCSLCWWDLHIWGSVAWVHFDEFRLGLVLGLDRLCELDPRRLLWWKTAPGLWPEGSNLCLWGFKRHSVLSVGICHCSSSIGWIAGMTLLGEFSMRDTVSHVRKIMAEC